ncbi:hypothetical protein ACFV1L_31665 [Kitasatospora sp. NPDC059646]|uniref:hypothetical protein n=1 Tax=Kitasatospora sp. NPDC059646 TaxID=3346893 RepID=UPI0036AE1D90
MNMLGRPATAMLGAAGSAVAALATVAILAGNWRGCDAHLEPGSLAALNLLLPVLFAALAFGGALTGSLTDWTGLRRRSGNPELVRLLGVGAGIVLTAVVLLAVLTVPADPSGCPVP